MWQVEISSFELLAQILLLQCRCTTAAGVMPGMSRAPGFRAPGIMLVAGSLALQWSDSEVAVQSSKKGFSTASPLGDILKAGSHPYRWTFTEHAFASCSRPCKAKSLDMASRCNSGLRSGKLSTNLC